jgi:hypothetical protein
MFRPEEIGSRKKKGASLGFKATDVKEELEVTTCKCGRLGYHVHILPDGTFAYFFDEILLKGGFQCLLEAQTAMEREQCVAVGSRSEAFSRGVTGA